MCVYMHAKIKNPDTTVIQPALIFLLLSLYKADLVHDCLSTEQCYSSIGNFAAQFRFSVVHFSMLVH